MAGAILVSFRWALGQGYSEEQARTVALTLFVMLNFWLVHSTRAENRSQFVLNPIGNRLLLGSALGALIIHAAATQWSATDEVLGLVPLEASEWLVCWLLEASVLVVVELDKLVHWRARVRSGRQRFAPG